MIRSVCRQVYLHSFMVDELRKYIIFLLRREDQIQRTLINDYSKNCNIK